MSNGESKAKKTVEEITDAKAAKILGDTNFVREKKVNRIFHVVRDPRNPNIILSMTVMEQAGI